ncbi:hypothetical protein [uncultured Amaricoccus sp.]|mgnify:CR=1 FL=1|uniref:hypothetical protein n=1 Tax=uncultured Amaricoccus sp. TaxID=339341 RepID=UPI0026395728|nr:hypothetical protein [uncultured Amaricoccus sp.]
MRGLLAAILMGLALWRAAADWQATIGQGYAYRLTPIGQVIEAAAPETYASVIGAWKATSVPYLWDPVGATLMSLPLALVLAALAALVWFTRRRR